MQLLKCIALQNLGLHQINIIRTFIQLEMGSGRNYQKLQDELQLIEREIKKYQQMHDIAQYQHEIYEEKGDIIHDTYDETLQRDLSVYMFDVESLRKELKQITETIADNTL